ncbi:hypothetical protein SESBI_41968 [Sesbania bispinosa]|nr:hypothetical protein SESBI_41968 [Sesbania bispinosa]
MVEETVAAASVDGATAAHEGAHGGNRAQRRTYGSDLWPRKETEARNGCAKGGCRAAFACSGRSTAAHGDGAAPSEARIAGHGETAMVQVGHGGAMVMGCTTMAVLWWLMVVWECSRRRSDFWPCSDFVISHS